MDCLLLQAAVLPCQANQGRVSALKQKNRWSACHDTRAVFQVLVVSELSGPTDLLALGPRRQRPNGMRGPAGGVDCFPRKEEQPAIQGNSHAHALAKLRPPCTWCRHSLRRDGID